MSQFQIIKPQKKLRGRELLNIVLLPRRHFPASTIRLVRDSLQDIDPELLSWFLAENEDFKRTGNPDRRGPDEWRKDRT